MRNADEQAALPPHAATLAWQRLLPWLPYALTGVVLLFLLLRGEKFWLTNDDIRMAMTVGGYGIAAMPSPGLVLETNVVWGWMLQHVPDVAGLRGYTLATYTLFLASGIAIGMSLRQLKVPELYTSACLLVMYSAVILFPQFTLLSGYLAAAGFALVLASGSRRLRYRLPAAALLLIFAGLIRPDEMALVFLVAAPFLLHAWRGNPRGWRLAWLGTAGLCGVVLAGAFVFNLHYSSSGDWQQFGDIDTLRGEFTDYNLGSYFINHPDKLAASQVSVNDIKLIRSWFYADPTVFNSANFAPLVDSVSLEDRIVTNAGGFGATLKLFKSGEMLLLLVLFLTFVLQDWRRGLTGAASLAILLLLMVGVGLWGRPGIERIYAPALAAMVVLALLKLGQREGRITLVIGVVALAASLFASERLYVRSQHLGAHARAARAATCKALPTDRLVVVWSGGGVFVWKEIYRPTTRDDDVCDPKLYPIGSYQLAPPSLAQLHAATGGKDLVPALLAGQQLYFVTSKGRLKLLDKYLQEHYHRSLQWQPMAQNKYYQGYLVQTAPAP